MVEVGLSKTTVCEMCKVHERSLLTKDEKSSGSLLYHSRCIEVKTNEMTRADENVSAYMFFESLNTNGEDSATAQWKALDWSEVESMQL
jgi:hypothetical protein